MNLIDPYYIWGLLTAAFYKGESDVAPTTSKPNIIFMVADDLGWNDVGWHNPNIRTPNLDVLAKEGVILDAAYAPPLCTPSRASMLSGYYPFRVGLQHGAIKPWKPHGVPLNVTLLPKHLRNLGYDTHIVGKWHLGFCKWEYTPTYRGFDTFYGFYTGHIDYYTHKTGKSKGLDFRRNTGVLRGQRGKYSTDLFTARAVDLIEHHDRSRPMFLYLPFQAAHAPLQAPAKFLEKYSNTQNIDRQTFSAMVSSVDDGVGQILNALMSRDMLENSLIIFTSDNGANPFVGGSNWPLRGAKSTLWEGGTRVPTFVWGPMLKKTGYVNKQIIHAVDWYSTILAAAGGDPDTDVDGVNQLPMLMYGERSQRKEFMYSINEISDRSAIRVGKYKLVDGSAGGFNDWYPVFRGPTKRPRKDQTRQLNQTLLFDLEDDPNETIDISWALPDVVASLKGKIAEHRAKLVPAANPRKVTKSQPKFWNGVWSPGWC